MKQKNLWQESSKENISFEPLKDSVVSDLAIIGGGYTGCSAALATAKKGLSVALIDQKIGYGGSGRNVGLVNAGLWLHPKKVEKILGLEAGVKLNNALANAPDLVFGLINENEINCSANRSGTLHCAHSQTGLVDIELLNSKSKDESYYTKKKSFIARLGSGSASRSIEGPITLWGSSNSYLDSSDLYAINISNDVDKVFHDYQNSILIIDPGVKKISSSIGHKLMNENPFSKTRFDFKAL